MTSFHSSSLIRTISVSRVTPALATRMSTGPSSDSTRSTSAATCSGSATSRLHRDTADLGGQRLGDLGARPVVDRDAGSGCARAPARRRRRCRGRRRSRARPCRRASRSPEYPRAQRSAESTSSSLASDAGSPTETAGHGSVAAPDEPARAPGPDRPRRTGETPSATSAATACVKRTGAVSCSISSPGKALAAFEPRRHRRHERHPRLAPARQRASAVGEALGRRADERAVERAGDRAA